MTACDWLALHYGAAHNRPYPENVLMTEAVADRLQQIKVGQSESYARTITDADIVLFAGVSGDDNPVHLNEVYAQTSMFKGRIAHGMLSASYISTVIGTRLPGPGTIYMGQTLKFRAPVRVGDTVTATVTVREIDEVKRRLTLDTVCTVDDKPVIEGEALVMLLKPEAPGA
jgi:3-hydroxybutyryl-CoA dehydratase